MAVELYPSAGLRRFMAETLGFFGLTPDDALLGATVLHDADLAGIDTHGIANLATHAHYVPGLRNGEVSIRPDVTVLRDMPVAAAWDSGQGFGPIIAHKAMERAIEKAQAAGIGMVTVRNGRHFGANGYFAEMAAARGLFGMVTANTPAVAFAPGAKAPVVGTNPFAFAAPVGGGPPLVVDIAMTTVSGTRVSVAEASGAAIPKGWVLDDLGQPSTDPSALMSGGGLELLGGQLAGHKGFGLALVVEMLAILAGNPPGMSQEPWSASWSQGQWFAAFRVDLFAEPQEYLEMTRQLAERVHGVPHIDGLLLPGERRARCRIDRSSLGVPLAPRVVAPLRRLTAETGVEFPHAVGRSS